jgi:hypothetical protein
MFAATLSTSATNSMPLPASGVYCINGKYPALRTLVFRQLAHHRLLFALSMFEENAQSIGVYGVADPITSNKWAFRSGRIGTDDYCKVYIRWENNVLIFMGDSVAACKADGGAGTRVGFHRFPMKYYEKPVTWEFRDEETAMEKSGSCWRHNHPPNGQ